MFTNKGLHYKKEYFFTHVVWILDMVSLLDNFRCIDQAVLVCKDLGDYRDVASLAERACNLYQQHGSPDSGSASLDKAAKLLESQHPEQALRLYQRATEVVLVCTTSSRIT
jgi:tetratricopeptide (TPR) repeat protein